MLVPIETMGIIGYKPSEKDIEEAINIAKSLDCWVKIVWRPNVYTYEYSVLIKENSVLEEVMNLIPTSYPV